VLCKLASSIEMSFKVSDQEKESAKKAIEYLNNVENSLKLSLEHLDIIYYPFKKTENLSAEKINEKRGLLNRYRTKVKKNFNKFKFYCFKALLELNNFANDTKIREIINAFNDNVNLLQNKVEKLLNVLDDYKNPEYVLNIIVAIDSIKKVTLELQSFINDRIKAHLEKNVLVKDWLSDNNFKNKIKEKIPIITQLYNEREGIFNSDVERIPDIAKRPQSLNPVLEQQIMYPTDQRPAETDEK
jgi:hypothetical protein